MAEVRVGNIVYQVSMDVAQLLTAQRQVNERLDRMELGMDRANVATKRLSSSMSSLSAIAASLIAALYVRQIAEYADVWTNVNNKLVNSQKAHEELNTVTTRVFDIAQRTRTSLEATATLYGRLEKATRSLNMSAKDLGDMTETINKALIVSGATAAESSSVLIQLSQALAAGALRGEEFNSVSENGIRIMQAIADYLGKDIGQLKELAAQGKLTSKIVIAAMKASADKIAKEFAKTTSTIEQAFVVANNNVTKFVGESSKVSTAANIFNKSLVSLSGNLDTFATAIGMVALAAVAKFNGALAGKVKTTITSMQSLNAETAAAHTNALATEHAAIAANRKAIADREQAILAYQVAEAEFIAAKGTQAEMIATNALIASKEALAVTQLNVATTGKAAAAATAAVGVAAKNASVGLRLLGNAFAFVGGWFGLITIAAGIFYYMYEKTKQASDGAREYAKNLGNVKEKLKDLSAEEVAAEVDKMNRSIKQMEIDAKNSAQKIKELQQELDKFKDPKKRAIKIAYYTSNGMDRDFAEQAVADDEKNAQEALTQAKADHVRITRELNKAKADSAIMTDIGNKKIEETNKLIYEQGKKEIPNNVKEWENAGKTYGEVVELIKTKLSSLGIAIKSVGGDTEEVNKKMQAMIKKAERDVKIASIPDEKGKIRQQAEFDAEDAGAAPGSKDSNEFVALIMQEQELKEAAEERKKAEQEAESAAKKAASEAENRSKQIKDSLKRQRDEIDRLRTGYEEGSREMALYDAAKAMPEGSSEEQIEKARRNASERYDLEKDYEAKKWMLEQDSLAKSKKAMDEELEHLRRVIKDKEELHKREQEIRERYKNKQAEDEINKKVDSSVGFNEGMLGKVDPIQQLQNEYAQKMAMLDAYNAHDIGEHERILQLKSELTRKFNDDMTSAQWEQWKGQNEMYQFLGDAVEALGQRSANAITGLLTGTQTANEAMRNLALTITNEAVSALVQMGMQQIKNMIIGKATNTAAAASAVATGATITTAMAPAAAATSVATMGTAATFGMMAMATAVPAMIALLGARKNGGPVSPNGAYRIGENNKPEIFKANNGNQYLVPGDRGKVISNREMGKGGNGGIVVNQINNFNVSNSGQFTAEDAKMLSGFVRREVYDILVNEISREEGLLNQ
ncbi:tape measure protein [Xenorhabdus sp. BG5]|uniref:tape measure protein n=1 Tax=Xenorhabdus sp. BG5 TaxID=2782014 RepID=UPI0018804BDE|nr:tape measure protein [Xenorhabdus sp. BG5]MBE8597925.1 tape measure protein [Xenorhabdus sp. BG5]